MIGATGYSVTAEINRQTNLAKQIARGQTDVSTQTRIQNDSDDPAAAARIAVIRRDQASQSVWSTNLDTAATTATRVDSTLASVSNSLQRAVELMTNARNGTLSDSDRASIASELDGIASDISTAMSATDSSGNPLFPNGAPIQYPVGDGQTLTATDSRAKIFGVTTGGNATDVLSIIQNAATAVRGNDSAAIGTSLTAVTDASSAIADARGVEGVRAARIDNAKSQLQTTTTSLAAERSGLQDTDIAATLAQIQSKLVTLQAAQATFAQLNKQTLFSLIS